MGDQSGATWETHRSTISRRGGQLSSRPSKPRWRYHRAVAASTSPSSECGPGRLARNCCVSMLTGGAAELAGHDRRQVRAREQPRPSLVITTSALRAGRRQGLDRPPERARRPRAREPQRRCPRDVACPGRVRAGPGSPALIYTSPRPDRRTSDAALAGNHDLHLQFAVAPKRHRLRRMLSADRHSKGCTRGLRPDQVCCGPDASSRPACPPRGAARRPRPAGCVPSADARHRSAREHSRAYGRRRPGRP